MSNFETFFTLYEPTDSPPIETEGYRKTKELYKSLLGSTSITDNSDLPVPEKDVSDIAKQLVGTRYSWRGTTPSIGFDDMGLLQYIYKQVGITLPSTYESLETIGSEVTSLDDIKEGDIILTSSPKNHVKIVSKVDNDQIYTIEVKSKTDGVLETPLNTTSNITSIRRVVNDSNYIIDYFVNKGLTRNQAKGIYGNLMQESGGNISAVSKDGHNSYGLAQWTGDRKQRLFDMFGTNPSAQQQLDFLWWELNNTHRSTLEALKQSKTVYDSTKVFMDKFERPHKDYANFSRRLRFANSIN